MISRTSGQVFLLIALTLLTACGVSSRSESSDDDPAGANEPNGQVTIFAATSLTDAFELMRDDLESDYPDLSLTFNFAGSSALRTQLEEGARADVFASANLTQMDAAREAGRIAGEPEIFARNRLVVIVPADNPAGIETLADLATPDVLLVLAQSQVPVGEYARESLGLMSQDSAFDHDFEDRVLANVVSEEPNPRAIATKVRLGEADAGVIYASDVTDDLQEDVLVIDIPDEFNVIAEYPVAIVEGASNTAAADLFLEYLLGPEGQATLQEHGFHSLDD